jgi:hypothetical protein
LMHRNMLVYAISAMYMAYMMYDAMHPFFSNGLNGQPHAHAGNDGSSVD